MADNLAQRLNDALLRRDIDISRLSEGDIARLIHDLEDLSGDLFTEVAKRGTRFESPRAQQSQIDEIVTANTSAIRDFFRQHYIEMRAKFLELMADEMTYFQNAVGRGLGISLETAQTLVSANVPKSIMTEIIDNRVITANATDAERLRGFFEREAGNYLKRYSGTLRQAFSQDETISQVLARLKMVTEASSRGSIFVIRSGYNHVVNNLRIEMMQRNSVLFRGVIAIAVLDTRTTDICKARSRGMWDLNTGQPLPDSPVQSTFPGPTPWHGSCRSQLYPLTQSADDIEANGNDGVQEAIQSLTPEQRNLLSPDPPEDENYTQWLRRQPVEEQVKALGRGRYELWNAGKIGLQDLVTQRGRPLTLAQIKRRTG